MKGILKLNIIIACLFLLTNTSCQKDGIDLNDETDYLIFGSSYGFCMGECATTYLLKSDGLYKSATYLKTGDLNTFNEELSEEKFNQIKGLEQKIPAEFLEEKKDESTFGCPDCSDQGRLYLEISIGGRKKRFNIDNYTENLPEHVKSIALDIRANINIARE